MSVSLKKRFIHHSAITLALLMSVCALVVYFNFVAQVKRGAQEQLQLHVYNILSVAEFDERGIHLPDILHNPDFNTMNSGLWAMVLDSTKKPMWQSLSIDSPVANAVLPEVAGIWQAGEIQYQEQNYVTMSYKIQWETGNDTSGFYLVIGESTENSKDELRRLTYWLVLGFGGISAVLLIGQYIVLKQAFRPIRVMEKEIIELEDGEIDRLSKSYPEELRGVERNINALILKEHKQRERYRESMANLAHSLKTPITIISNELAHYPENNDLQNAIQSVNNSIEYQLRRAVISGHTLVSSGVKIDEVVDLILEAVAKIYSEKRIEVDKHIDENAIFFGDENDLMEVFGNLIDNAFKFAEEMIKVTATPEDSGVYLAVEDDGPGLECEDPSRVFKRGERLDQRNVGQGIGLSIVDDIVTSYEGEISVSRSDLGGAIFRIKFKNREDGV